MDKNIKLKLANKNEIRGLDALFNDLFQREISQREIVWRFIENPLLSNNYYNLIALNADGEIIGHTAFIPMLYTTGEKDLVKGALSVGSAVRGKYAGIFPKLYFSLEEKLIADGFDFVFAFPNEISYLFFAKYFKYQTCYFDYLQLKVADLSIGNNSSQTVSGLLVNKLGKDFLDWRIDRSPINQYQTIENESSMLIYKQFNEDECDILAIKPKGINYDLSILRELVKKDDKITKINFYSTNCLFSDALMKVGFNKVGTRNKLAFKALNQKLRSSNLALQMIDSDIF